MEKISFEIASLLLIFLLIRTITAKTMIFSSAPIPCDFEKYPTVGCEDSAGSYCDLETSRCHCKTDYPIRLFKYCLRYVGINETCYTSRQCNETLNAACYILGTEYDHSGGHNVGFQLSDWPEGKCRCRLGHQFDTANGTCIKRTIGSWCNTDRDCTKENFHSFCNRKSSICECVYGYIYDSADDTCSPQRLYGSKCRSSDDCARDQLVCTGGRCKCPKGSHWDAIYPGSLCKPNNDSACAYGYRWDSDKERCALKIFKDDDGEDLDGLDNVGLTGSDLRPTRGRGGNSSAAGGDGDSFSMASIVIIVLINLAIILVVLRYWYIRKREDSDEDLTERGHIRPTLKPYYGDHLIHAPGVVPMGSLEANGIKCPLSVDDSVIDCDGMVKCASTSSSPGQHARNHHHHHHPIHPTLSDTIVPYGGACPIGHCQGHCPGHLDVLECEVVGCHQINGINMGCNLGDDLTANLIDGNIINTNINDSSCLIDSPTNKLKSVKREIKSMENNINGDDDVDDGLGSLGNQEENDDNSNNQDDRDVNSCQNIDKMKPSTDHHQPMDSKGSLVKEETKSVDSNNSNGDGGGGGGDETSNGDNNGGGDD